MSEQAREIIKANREALEQGLTLLSMLNDDQYAYLGEPRFTSTIGQHVRHVVDMYLALMVDENNNLIDYDCRRRGSLIESSCVRGIEALRKVLSWLDALDPMHVARRTVLVKSEVSLQKSASVTLESSLMRELVFVGSHTVHHYALIKVIANDQGLHVATGFGIAPATASFLRNEVECAQ